ncbi:MAG: HAD family phosphatase [Thalassovita sp.]
MPQAYLFDMDGLLLDTERVALRSFLKAIEGSGVPLATAEPFFMTLVGTSVAHSNQMMDAFLPSSLDADQVRADWDRHFAAELAQGVPLRPTVRETLAALAGQGARMAVVTSTKGRNARAHLDHAGLLAHFDFVVGGDEVVANKPDPAPYLKAAAEFGFDPQDCAAFEDSDKGIAAAMAAGCHAVQIPDLRPEGTALPKLGQMLAKDLAEAVTLAQASVAAGRRRDQEPA